MMKLNKLSVLAIFFLIQSLNFAQKKEIVAYYHGTYHKNHIAQEKYLLDKDLIDKITVINYAFSIPVQDSTGKIVPLITNPFFAYQEYYSTEMSVDGIADDSSQTLRGQFNQLRKLKKLNPDLKILISIGGWGGSKYFSDLALTASSREHFVDSCLSLFISGNLPIVNGAGGNEAAFGVFDGIDLDWEFPITGGPEGTHYNENDRENHTELFKLFREKLNKIDKNLLLTAAVTGRSNEFWQYNFSQDQQYLDWFNLMSYDLHGSAENLTG
ncbi:MAG: hypothetical protein KDC52_10575, partial [Ignavibacteriae bacterium]|nr:hypothetical protein [Ignavibacteriota bacterium]